MHLFPFHRPRSADAEPPDANRERSASPRRWGRWVLAVIIVAVLHWSAMRWIDRVRQPSNAPPTEPPPVQIDLLTPKPVAPPVPTPSPPKSAALKPAAPKPAPQPAPIGAPPAPDATAAASQ